MIPNRDFFAAKVSVAFCVTCLGLLWLIAVPEVLSGRTYLLFAGAATIVLVVAGLTVRNSQDPTSVGQIIHNIESAPAAADHRAAAAATE
jgi:hypothetical protein